MKGALYTTDSTYISIWTPDGIKKYRRYKQYAYRGYISSRGCIQTAVAILASSYGKNYNPNQIHGGSANSKYSERYALRKMKASSSRFGRAAITVATASQILKDLGIKNKPVYTVNVSKAAKELEEHVKTGKPALVKANSRWVNGLSMSYSHHAMLLIGVDQKGNGIFIDPWNATVNYAHRARKYFKMSIKKFVKDHMFHPTQKKQGAFVSTYDDQGGYILVG